MDKSTAQFDDYFVWAADNVRMLYRSIVTRLSEIVPSVADVLSANQRGLLQNGGAGSLADGRHVCGRLTRDKKDGGKRHSEATVRRETIDR